MSHRPITCVWLLVGFFASAGCRTSFRLGAEAEAGDLANVAKSVFVIIAMKEELQGDPCDLVGPDSEGKYKYFAQFLPGEDGKGWKLAFEDGVPLEPKAGKDISLKVPKNIIEVLAGCEVALVVKFPDRSCQIKSTPLLAKGVAHYTIGDTRLGLQ